MTPDWFQLFLAIFVPIIMPALEWLDRNRNGRANSR